MYFADIFVVLVIVIDTAAVEKQQDGTSTTDTPLRAAADSNKPLWRVLELPSMDLVSTQQQCVHYVSRARCDCYLLCCDV